MEKICQYTDRECWVFQNITQGWNNFLDEGLLLKFIEEFGNAVEELDLLGLVFLMDVFQISNGFQQRILEPRILDVLCKTSAKVGVFIHHLFND